MLAATAGLQPASHSADLEDAEVDFENLATEQPAPVRRKLSRLGKVRTRKENVVPQRELHHKLAASPPDITAPKAPDHPAGNANAGAHTLLESETRVGGNPCQNPESPASPQADGTNKGPADGGNDAPPNNTAAATIPSSCDANRHTDSMPKGSKIALDDEASGSAGGSGDASEEEGDGDSAMSGEGDDEAGSKAGSEMGDEGGDGDADASDAEGGAWDEEDEMDDAFRRERLHDMTQDGSGSDSEGGGSGGSGSEAEGSQGGNRGKRRSKRDSKELNAKTQRMLRDSAVRDRIGKGHNPDIAPLSGIVAKLKAQQQALVAKALAMKAVKRKVWSPQAALPPPNPTPALLQPPADDEDLMILSDDENFQEGAAAMGGGATESQDLGQGLGGPSWSLPPFIPESQQPSLNLRLESQTQAEEGSEDAAGSGSSEDEGSDEEDEDEEGGSGDEEAASQAASSDGEEQGTGSDHGSSSEDGSDEEEEEEEGEGADASSQPELAVDAAVSTEAPSPMSAAGGSPLPSQGEAVEGEEASDPAKTESRRDAFKLLQQAGAGVGKEKRPAFFKDSFVDMEAEMSDDGGHSDDGEDEDADADGMLADLMGVAKEGARDGRLRAGLHSEWLQEQDKVEMAAVVAGMQRGWRKPGGNTLQDDEYQGTDRETRRRLAAQGGEDGEAPDFDLAALFPTGGVPGDGAEGEDSGDEAELAQAYAAQRLLAASQDLTPLSILDAGSQEMLAMLTKPASQEAVAAPKRSWLGGMGVLRPDMSNQPGTQKSGSFLGHHSKMHKQRGSSSLLGGAASRSFVFRTDDSNSAMVPSEKEGSGEREAKASRVEGPTSFAGGIRQMAAASKRTAAGGRPPALMTMLSNGGSDNSDRGGANAMSALKMASFKRK